MCLERIDSVKKFKNIERRGYKTFIYNDGVLSSILEGTGTYPVGVWINEIDYRNRVGKGGGTIATPFGPEYPCGFHIHTSKEGCNRWSGQMRVVRFRDVAVRGNQRGDRVVVAREMFITNEIISGLKRPANLERRL